MTQVFGLKYSLPKELQFIGSILENSDGIRIVNMPRQVRTERERLDEASKGGDGNSRIR